MGSSEMKARVVLDTNVVLSALVFTNGRLSWIRREWVGAFIPLGCRETVAELLRALSYPKFKLLPGDREELLADYLPYLRILESLTETEDLPSCSDPADQVFLELASAGKASFLVTGDRALLELDGRCSFRIVSPGAFAGALEKD